MHIVLTLGQYMMTCCIVETFESNSSRSPCQADSYLEITAESGSGDFRRPKSRQASIQN